MRLGFRGTNLLSASQVCSLQPEIVGLNRPFPALVLTPQIPGKVREKGWGSRCLDRRDLGIED